ncbi:hypothetical protein ACQCS9_27110, partial [Ralstonia pseudosolanacearum]
LAADRVAVGHFVGDIVVDAGAAQARRGDGGVIERHLQALDTLGADHVALYAALTRRALALAAERGHPPADVLDALAARLPGAQ